MSPGRAGRKGAGEDARGPGKGDHTLQSVIAIRASLNAGTDRPPAPRASLRFPLDSRRCAPRDGAHPDADPCGVARSGKAITLCKV